MNRATSALAMDQALPPGYNPNVSAIRDPGPAAIAQAFQQAGQRADFRSQEQAAQAATLLRRTVDGMKQQAGLPSRAEQVAQLVSNMPAAEMVDLGLK